MEKEYTLFTFASSHLAIAAELCIREKFTESRLIPIPPTISAGCGLALQVKKHNRKVVRTLLKDAQIEIKGEHNKK